ncbi:MAG: metal-dependent hydrolase, partial [Trueperaceae bacterium]|nr:metal-dependent hydrolase [Trueperaceae bacterium]
ERRFGHRTLTHSFLGMVLFALFSVWLIPISLSAWVCLLLGIGSHIVLDSHNVTGVPLLYPLRIEFVSIYNRGLRTPYGSPLEFSYLAGFSLLALALTPLSLDGFSPWFHRALGAPYGAVEDYVSWRNDFEVWAEVSGINLVTDETIDGRYLVIDALGRETLLLEDGTGKAYTAALSGSDIQVRRIKVWKGERIVSSTYRLDLSGRLMSDLLAS